MPLIAGEILLLPGGVNHGIEVQGHFRMAIIHFHPKTLGALGQRHGPLPVGWQRLKTWSRALPCRKVVAPDMHEVLERITQEAVVEQNRREHGREVLLGSLAVQAAVYFVRLMFAATIQEPPDEASHRVLKVRSWIDRHFAEPCGVGSLAEMACLAPTYFAARFQQLLGVAPMTYVRSRRIEQARLLLERTGQPVKVIAWNAGFTDVSHFNHTFKKVTGLAPVEYRQQSRPGPV